MNKNILVIDDELSIRELLTVSFEREGFQIHTAATAEEGWDILGQENIQVMFLDLKLPGMNGIDLCRRIRREYPIAVIHAITGYSSLYELAECREAGFDDYFTKPLHLATLNKAAKDAFEKLERWARP